MPQRQLTTGIFRVPDLPAAMGPALLIAVSSFLAADVIVDVSYVVNRIEEDGTKTPLHDGSLVVRGPGTFDKVIVPVWQVKGSFLEVHVDLPFPGLHPSVAVVTSFIGDESTQLEEWISPRDFTPR